MNFLGMGPGELVLIMVLALIVFGPGKLPEIAGQVGKAVRDIRRATTDLSSEFNRTLSLELDDKKEPADAATPAASPPSPSPASTTPPASLADASATIGDAAEGPSPPVVPAAAASTATGSEQAEAGSWHWEGPGQDTPGPAPRSDEAAKRKELADLAPPY